MGIVCKSAPVAPATQLVPGCKSGIYRSKKGSVVIVPDSNGKTKRGVHQTSNINQCLVTDVDSGKTFLKDIARMKGEYSYVCPLDIVELHYGTPQAANGCQRDF